MNNNRVLFFEDLAGSKTLIEEACELNGLIAEVVEDLPEKPDDTYYEGLIERIASGEFCMIVLDAEMVSDGRLPVYTFTHLIPRIRPVFSGLMWANSSRPDFRIKQMKAGCDKRGAMYPGGRTKNFVGLAIKLAEILNSGRNHSAKVNAVAQAA
jgi:hypothetical protein